MSQAINQLKLKAIDDRIMLLIEVASANGHAMSVKEILDLLPETVDFSAEELAAKLVSDNQFSEKVTVKGGLVAAKGFEHCIYDRPIREARASWFRGLALQFARQLMKRCPEVRLIGLSGSVAFNSPAKDDDIDLFIVAADRAVWRYMFKAHLLRRVFILRSLLSRFKAPKPCLNFSYGETECLEKFKRRRSPLFAREALALDILAGSSFYANLLSASPWMRDFFPKLYDWRLREVEEKAASSLQVSKPSNRFSTIIENILYGFMSLYFRMHVFLHNVEARKTGRFNLLTEAELTRNALSFTTERYRSLRGKYEKLNGQNPDEDR